MTLYDEVFEKYEGRCVICAITSGEGGLNGVYSMFQERPIDTATFDKEELIVLCGDCRKDIQAHFTGGTAPKSVIKKFLRLRGQIAQEIDRRRKEKESCGKASKDLRRIK